MNHYDAAIYSGRVPVEPTPGTVPAAPGSSYYWDARAEGLTHAQAVRRAAREMGSVLASLQAVQR